MRNTTLARLWHDRRGAELVEVLVVLAIIALGGLAAMRALSGSVGKSSDVMAARIVAMDGSGAGGAGWDLPAKSSPQPSVTSASTDKPNAFLNGAWSGFKNAVGGLLPDIGVPNLEPSLNFARALASPVNQALTISAGQLVGAISWGDVLETGGDLLGRAKDVVVEVAEGGAALGTGVVVGALGLLGIPLDNALNLEDADWEDQLLYGIGQVLGGSAETFLGGGIIAASIGGGGALCLAGFAAAGVGEIATCPVGGGIAIEGTIAGAAVAANGLVGVWNGGDDIRQALSRADSTSSGGTSGSRSEPLPKGDPDPNATARGTPEEIDPRASSQKQRNVRRQNDSADVLAREGYDIEHNSVAKPNGKVPDYRISGEYVDHLNPSTGSVEQALKGIKEKIAEGQVDRVVVRLDDTSLSIDDVRGILQRKPVSGLKEVIFIKDGQVVSYVP